MAGTTERERKYRPFPPVDLPDRQWPSKTIDRPPAWCSVDLRDGNQALKTPMSVAGKRDLFLLLSRIGFREIEVGFPSASATEYAFTRELIEGDLIPDGVTIQVLTQSREGLIRRTFDSIRGARRAVVHLYNSTSTLQRRVVFGMNRREIVDLAVRGTRLVRKEADGLEGTEVLFEYSPESFTGTELGFALEICEAVLEAWGPAEGEKVILNLPATVEMATPNVYADQIEWFRKHLSRPDRVTISVHAHNDRGTAVAATELALLAGAGRVEGTLFGNGERTGNVDIVTLALNMFSHGVDPGLDFEDIGRVVRVYERCTGMSVHPRHPYAGELVYTAFSGSHQDAISKGIKALEKSGSTVWQVPYLPIDPRDIGRTYKSIIRINSQSGKGGVAYVLEREYGYELPRAMHPEVGALVQEISERTGDEVTPAMIRQVFEDHYLRPRGQWEILDSRVEPSSASRVSSGSVTVRGRLRRGEEEVEIEGAGNGPIDAFCDALRRATGLDFALLSYHEHSLEEGSDSRAVSYIGIGTPAGTRRFGVGIDTSISVAAFRAIVCALNRLQ